MHGPDPSWCARLHAPPRPPVPEIRAEAGTDANDGAPETAPSPSGTPGAQPPRFVPREIPSVHVCELCGTTMYDHNCKIVCPNCGYKRDCSDP